ncbi:Hpt domain-containing protein [Methanospirillum stamsii]|uniref:Chemotaxis protein CheA n=1 Tax=Methanospirillum stamsii TaxID=1277351 RepID=A0A2V2NAM5_9EURY|nr:Hpt domain-containing protein [Methanospirillum stamsii]PWR75800.1 chemotaxis protein CheA [Methanospirillum stamsii]
MSDLDAYRSLYVAESRENLEGIVSNLLILEKGTDSHAIDEIFRSAHSLKGMSASMGFMHMEEICHALEDVFSQIRSQKLDVTQSLVDDLLGGADDIEQMIDEIEAGGDGQLDHKDQRVKTLKKWLVQEGEDKKPTPVVQPVVPEPGIAEETTGDMYEGPSYEQDFGEGCRDYTLDIVLADNVDNKNLRGMLILQNLESIGEITRFSPERDIIEDDENFSGTISLVFRTNAGEEAIRTILNISDIKSSDVTGVPKTSPVIPTPEIPEPALIPGEIQSEKGTCYDIRIEISPSVDSKNLRSMLLLQNLEVLGSITEISPKRDIIEDSSTFDGTISLTLRSESSKDKIESLLKGSDVRTHSIAVQENLPVGDITPSFSVEGSDEVSLSKFRSTTTEKVEKKREVKNIRVDIDRLDHMMNLVEDLVINRGRLEQIAQEYKIKELDETLNMVGRSVSDLQVMMMDIRMIPLNQIFNRFPRTVRDIAAKEGKEVDFVVEGGDTELDRSVLDGLNDPLLHLIRNGLDHGIESPEVRVANGKNPKGRLKLSASRDKDNVVIVIEDDGCGVNVEKIKKKALERGLVSEDVLASMSDQDAYDLLFQPGFSTADKITDISGRGVGLDVVKTTIASLQGTIKLESFPGEGSRFELVLPPTMAIVMVMMIRINGKRCAIPITNVAEVASLAAFPIQNIGNGEGLLMRDEIIVLYRLDDMFGRSKKEEVIVVLQNVEKKGAIIADLIEGQQEVVIKPLSKFVGTCEGVSGVTIPGDGEVVPVLDVKAILREGGQKAGRKAAGSGKRVKKVIKNVVTDTDLMISEQQADELRELGNIGAAHAATTLSTILSTMIQIRVPEIILVNLANLRNYLDDVKAAMVVFQIQGQIKGDGYLIIHIPEDSIIRLTNIMIGTTETNRSIDDMDRSAITEIGNIMTSSFLDACATLLSIIMIPSPPSMVIDMPHAALQSIIATQEIRENVDQVVLFRTELTCSMYEIKANIILLPSKSLLQEIFARMENVIATAG